MTEADSMLKNSRNRSAKPPPPRLRGDVAFIGAESGRVYIERLGRTLDLSAYKTRYKLAQAVCEAVWRKAHLSNEWGDQAVRRYNSSFRLFDQYLAAESADVCQPYHLTGEVMGGWRNWLMRQARSEASKEQHYGAIRLALQIYRSAHPEEFSPEFTVPKWPDQLRALRGNARRPFSDAELDAIRSAVKVDLQATVHRLNKGKQLLAAAGPPTGPFAQYFQDVGNTLWWITNKLDGRIYERAKQQHPADATRLFSGFSRRRGKDFVLSDAYALLYPTRADLLNILVGLMACDDVLDNRQPILDLKIGDLKKFGPAFFARLTKTRPWHKQYTARWKSAEGLLQMLLDMTAPLRAIAAEELKERLWLFYSPQQTGRGPVDSLHRSALYTLKWGSRHSIRDFQISRFRTTHLTTRYKKRGALAGIQHAAKHKRRDTTVGYVNNPATQMLHESSVENAQKAAFQELTVVPAVIEEEGKRLENALMKELSMTPDEAHQVIEGKSDLFFNSCKDFMNRPGGRKNTPCDQPFACLSCENAIYLRRHATILVALAGHFELKRAQEDSLTWRAKFGLFHLILTREVLPRFSPETLAAAAQKAKGMRFYVPKELQ